MDGGASRTHEQTHNALGEHNRAGLPSKQQGRIKHGRKARRGDGILKLGGDEETSGLRHKRDEWVTKKIGNRLGPTSR